MLQVQDPLEEEIFPTLNEVSFAKSVLLSPTVYPSTLFRFVVCVPPLSRLVVFCDCVPCLVLSFLVQKNFNGSKADGSFTLLC